MKAFLSSLGVDSTMIVGLLLLFSVLRRRFRLVYCGDRAPCPASASESGKRWGIFDWVCDSLDVTIDDIQEARGLDAAMLIEFSHLAMKISASIGVPICLLMCPLHWVLGGMPPGAVDALSRLGMANIARGSWLYWVHAAITWLVVVACEYWFEQAMESFLARRWRWLKTLPPPRSTTVLVENLPAEYCSDARLRAFFGKMFGPDQLEDVYVVRRTGTLRGLLEQRGATELLLRRAEAALEQTGRRPMHFVFGRGLVDAVERHREGLRRLSAEIARERGRVCQAALSERPDPAIFASNAFVTFSSRRDRHIALRLQYKPDAETFVVSVPPDPQDIRWPDLMVDPTHEAWRERFGYACALGLYVGFVPIIVAISSITNLDALQSRVPLVQQFVTTMPALATTLKGVLASLALTLFLSFLPTFFVLIFHHFFVLKADAWVQHRLQVWYFWFQVVFILLVTAVGGSVVIALERIVASPLQVFGLLADCMPSATHFYLNFMVLQWVTQALDLTRYMNLFKYLALKPIFGEQGAKERSEPEDQDFYGIGSRSARWTIWLIISLVFCQLSPLISILALVNAGICRLVYGYLLVFGERRKPDLGGVFFVQQLEHVRKGLLIYLVLMIGVLLRRGPGAGPTCVAVGALLYQVRMHAKFHLWFRWRSLPFEEIVEDAESPRHATLRPRYAQPELTEAVPGAVTAGGTGDA